MSNSIEFSRTYYSCDRLFSRLRRSRYGHPHRNSSVPDTSPFRLHANAARNSQPSPFGGGIKQSNSLDSLQVLGTAGDADLFIQSLMKPCNNSTAAVLNRKAITSRKGSKMMLHDGPRRRVSAPAPPILVHSTDGTTTVLEGTIEEPPSKAPMVNGNDNSDTNSPALPVSPLACSSFSKFSDAGKLRMLSSSLDSLLVDSGTLQRRADQFGLHPDQ